MASNCSETSSSSIVDIRCDVSNLQMISFICSEGDEVFVDLQGFETFNNKFVCKELSVLHSGIIRHFFLRSPYEFKKLDQSLKLLAFYAIRTHGIHFNSGGEPIVAVIQNLYKLFENRNIYVRNDIVRNWVDSKFGKYCEFKCTSMDAPLTLCPHLIYNSCRIHNMDINHACSMRNVIDLSIRFKINKKS